jgi:NAD(P)H dehydrogenase (quinone)
MPDSSGSAKFYEIPSLHLKEGLEVPGRTGFGLHVRD